MNTYISKDIQHTFIDYPDPEIDALIFFFLGCEHKCPDCQNKEFQQYNDTSFINNDNSLYVKIPTMKKFLFIIDSYVERYKTNYLILQGGDPLYKENIECVKALLRMNKEYHKYHICIYTGYDLDFLKENHFDDLIGGFDFIKCGVYDKTQHQEPGKNDSKFVLASKNQILYDKDLKQISAEGVYWFNSDKPSKEEVTDV